MCSDSESVGGSSESRSMDSPTASPGTFSGVNAFHNRKLIPHINGLMCT